MKGIPLLIIVKLAGILALKDVSVTVPQAVSTGDTVTLQCKYDLEGEALYMVKWYRGVREFYRYIPKEMPNTQVFPQPGLNVDLSKSTMNEVVLRNVQPEISGRFKCEVSSDSPNFYTTTMSGYMYVIDVPEEGPEMYVEKDLVEVGYTLKGNCTSPPSYPYINLTWYLNGRKVNESWMTHLVAPNVLGVDNRRKPMITVSGLELEIDSNTFQNGKARLKCVANIFSLYQREAELILDEERPRPRPSSVLGTRDTAAGSSVLLNVFVIPIIMLSLTFR